MYFGVYSGAFRRRAMTISVGAQLTLGEGRGKTFLPENICPKKITKYPNFTWYLPEKLTKWPNFTWFLPEKCIFPEFGRQCPQPPISYAYGNDTSILPIATTMVAAIHVLGTSSLRTGPWLESQHGRLLTKNADSPPQISSSSAFAVGWSCWTQKGLYCQNDFGKNLLHELNHTALVHSPIQMEMVTGRHSYGPP